MNKVQRPCPICECREQPAPTQFERDGWLASSCSNCGFLFLADVPDYSELSENLSWAKLFKKEATRRRKTNRILDSLDLSTRWRLKLLRGNEWNYISSKVRSGNVLDIGCSDVDRVPASFVPYGIEIAKDAAALSDALMRRRGGRVVHAPAAEGLSQFENNFFDGIIMRSYLEHEAKPREVLKACLEKLKTGGIIYVKVPNFECISRRIRGLEWCGFRFPDHVNYFDASSLQRLALDLGYEFELKNKLTRFTNDNIHCFLKK